MASHSGESYADRPGANEHEPEVDPPIIEIGALAIDEFIPKRTRKQFAAALNTLLAAPSFAN